MSKATKKQTPLMTQYYQVKEENPGTVLLFRVGDFYETFSEDAVLVSKELGITLTKRNNGGDATELAGFPYHALDTYLPKLIRRGHRVAVCEQLESPAEAKAQKKKIVKREVTEVVTPGVAMSEQLLDHNRNNYLCAIHQQGSVTGIAFSDVSTGEFALCQMAEQHVYAFLQSIQPSEILLPKKKVKGFEKGTLTATITPVEEWVFDGDYGYNLLVEHFKTHSLKGFGVDDLTVAHVSAGALLHYLRETQKSQFGHLRRLFAFESSDYMMLDPATKRNLELTASMQEGQAEGTLISILDETCTAMGGRMLRKWLMRPLKRIGEIRDRLNAVEIFHNRTDLRQEMREELEHIGDLERLISRICVGRTNARDLVQLKLSLLQIPRLKILLSGSGEPLLTRIAEHMQIVPDVQELVARAIVDEPPASVRDGNMIRDGYNTELDELRDISRNGKQYLAKIQKELSETSGIPSLKLGYNKVFGYYIEVTNTHKDKVPETFIRKQTLVNAERYITPELKEIEEKILSAEERIGALEYDLFRAVMVQVAERAAPIQDNAEAIAELDCLQSLAEVGFRYNYAKPKVDEGDTVRIVKGRHPVVER